jgi:hypothetical protein
MPVEDQVLSLAEYISQPANAFQLPLDAFINFNTKETEEESSKRQREEAHANRLREHNAVRVIQHHIQSFSYSGVYRKLLGRKPRPRPSELSCLNALPRTKSSWTTLPTNLLTSKLVRVPSSPTNEQSLFSLLFYRSPAKQEYDEVRDAYTAFPITRDTTRGLESALGQLSIEEAKAGGQ